MITIRNKSHHSLSLNLSKEYDGIGRSIMIVAKGKVEELPNEIENEMEVDRLVLRGRLEIFHQEKAKTKKKKPENKPVYEEEKNDKDEGGKKVVHKEFGNDAEI